VPAAPEDVAVVNGAVVSNLIVAVYVFWLFPAASALQQSIKGKIMPLRNKVSPFAAGRQ